MAGQIGGISHNTGVQGHLDIVVHIMAVDYLYPHWCVTAVDMPDYISAIIFSEKEVAAIAIACANSARRFHRLHEGHEMVIRIVYPCGEPNICEILQTIVEGNECVWLERLCRYTAYDA